MHNQTNEESLTKFKFTGADKTWWIWIVGGALYGIFLRVLFGAMPDDISSVMSIAFLIGTPFVLGALTVYGARHRNQTWVSFIFGPWLAVTFMLLGCAISFLEGSICLAIISPIFFVCASLGGVTMGIALKMAGKSQTHLRAVAILPFLIIAGENSTPLHEKQMVLQQSVVIDASPSTVWSQILTARTIKAEEVPFSVTHFIGVPKPIEGINVQTEEGEIRYSTWERGVTFRALVTNKRPYESITWHYMFDDKSFPPGSMDEHVAIGGKYFDLQDTTFNLYPLPGNKTKLEIVAHFRVSSSINFYAVPMATFIGRDFINSILGLYKGRSERLKTAAVRRSTGK